MTRNACCAKLRRASQSQAATGEGSPSRPQARHRPHRPHRHPPRVRTGECPRRSNAASEAHIKASRRHTTVRPTSPATRNHDRSTMGNHALGLSSVWATPRATPGFCRPATVSTRTALKLLLGSKRRARKRLLFVSAMSRNCMLECACCNCLSGAGVSADGPTLTCQRQVGVCVCGSMCMCAYIYIGCVPWPTYGGLCDESSAKLIVFCCNYREPCVVYSQGRTM